MIWILGQVALGGALGSLGRYGLQLASLRVMGPAFPVGTLALNVLGCLVMGLLFVWLTERGLMRFAPLLITGILGGFTTFSAFSLDALLLWEKGQVAWAAGYVLASVLLSLAAVGAGVWLMRMVMS